MEISHISTGGNHPDYRYQVGGSLPIHAPSYVTRKSDFIFYEHLKNGEFCYVLNSRQMGKSSLRVQTMHKLRAEGVLCASIDLTGFGTQGITPDKWYNSIIKALISDCQIKLNWRTWLKERDSSTPIERLKIFIEQILLESIPDNIVIFLDEIDLILNQSVSADDFLGLIRFFYNLRVDKPSYRRLTFALLGVATPTALMKDHGRTPFNIGKAINLKGFKLNEALPLARGLQGKVKDPEQILNEILDWTGGQPFLTQKLCQLMEATAQKEFEVSVEQVVRTQIIKNWESQDEPVHLRTIRDRILYNERKSIQILDLYQKVCLSTITSKSSPEQIELRLSGLVRDHEGILVVYNRIYSLVFNQKWIERELLQLRPYASAFNAWETSNHMEEKLLKGKMLKQSLNWAVGKSLSDRDYEFIRLSQVKAEREKLQRNIVLRNLLAVVGLGSILVTTLLWVNNRWQAENEQSLLEGIEQKHVELVQARQKNNQDEALYLAIYSGRDLKKLVGNQPLDTYPTTQPLLDLQQLLDEDDQSIDRWNLKPLKEEAIWDLDISPDGKSIAVSGWGNTVRVLRSKHQQQLTHRDAEMVISTDFNPRSDHIATASLNGFVRLWTPAGQLLQQWNTQQKAIWSTRFSPNGQYLATAGWDGTVRLWDLEGTLRVRSAKKHQGPVRDIQFTPDGEWLASAGEDGIIQLWKLCLNSGCTFTDDTHTLALSNTLEGHRGWIWSLDVSPEGKVLASAGEDGIIRFWDLENLNALPERWQYGHGRITQIRFSSDGQLLAIGSWDGEVQVRDLNGRIVAQWQSHRPITSIDITPDHQTLLVGTVMGEVHQWPIRNLDQLLDLGCQKLRKLNMDLAIRTPCLR
ncbi:AAA-like domain-containing protein [Acaryochloris sp. IP29b_bin.137]|uniref:AAA-like domain-containing protein n=1 Tax=Acaryochloris sp. IP29b_bin.137 TaxID=2969217 RepID=UPI00262C683E|nr:AAA-like domain-containing protein [Acaryochloris sp. IP29b_bin.137]